MLSSRTEHGERTSSWSPVDDVPVSEVADFKCTVHTVMSPERTLVRGQDVEQYVEYIMTGLTERMSVPVRGVMEANMNERESTCIDIGNEEAAVATVDEKCIPAGDAEL